MQNFGNKPGGKSPLAARTRTGKYHGKDVFLSEALTKKPRKLWTTPDNGQAFLPLRMAHYAIHTPIQPDMRFYQNIWTKDLSPIEAAYATLIEGMDKASAT